MKVLKPGFQCFALILPPKPKAPSACCWPLAFRLSGQLSWPPGGHGSVPALTCQQDKKEVGSKKEGLPTDDSLIPGISHVDGSTG